jgi:hypothetical protein
MTMLNEQKILEGSKLVPLYGTTLPQGKTFGYCAKAVCDRLIAGGFKDLKRVAHAKDLGNGLMDCGFLLFLAFSKIGSHIVHELATMTTSDFIASPLGKNILKPCDVVVIQPHRGCVSGHTAIFDGEQWFCDGRHTQGLYPNWVYRDEKPPFIIYRHPLLGKGVIIP